MNIRPKHILLFALLILLTSYSLYQARFLIIGPRITVTSHENGQVVENPVVTLSGKAKNIAKISLNDRQIFTDEQGLWSEKLIVNPGLSIMTLKASDRFGRDITKTIELFLN
jgi:hypothetical protein